MSEILPLIAGLADPEQRVERSRRLAAALGAESLLFFCPDPELGTLLPALPFPQTLPAGVRWHALLASCLVDGEAQDHLPSPYDGNTKPVFALAGADGSVLTLIGGSAEQAPVAEVRSMLPLLAAAFRGERVAQNARASSQVAEEAAARAKALAVSLDRVRHDLGEALMKANATSAENARLYQEVRDADLRKDEFLAMLGHELRNPLAPIQNALQIMKIAASDPIIMERAREISERQVRHLMRLVDDLLDVSRITRGKIRLRKSPVELSTIITNAIETSRPLIESRRHELTITYPPESIQVDADPVRLAQVLMNLLNNAAKYTEEGGNIWLTAETEGQMAQISVRDTGVGIAPDLLPKVFDLFTQIDRTLDRSQGGLGIGLTLVRRLIEMHGGDVRVYSAGPDRGTEFIVRLPILRATTTVPVARKRGSPRHSVRNRILVVDDNIDAAKTLAALLRLSGQEAQTAHEGAAAIEIARSWRPAMILLDIGLPGMDGYAVASRLQSDEQTKGIRLVALTGYGQEEDRRRTTQAGFERHFVKPADIAQILELLSSLPETSSAANQA